MVELPPAPRVEHDDGLVVRVAAAGDLAQLDALLGQLHKRSPPLDDIVRAAFDAVLRAPARLILVAQRDDRLVGTLDLFAIDNLTRGGRPWAGVENVVVDAGHRGRGVGGAMLSAAVSIARAARCTSCS